MLVGPLKSLALCLLALFAASLLAQNPSHVTVESIAPRPDDVATIDGVIKAFYDVISGPAGQPRQWPRDRTLYIPDVRFVSVQKKKDGTVVALPITHQEFVDRSDAYLVKNGFYETEIHRETQRFGQIAHVFSTYESRNKPDGPVIERGINSIELFNDGKRWWVLSAQWDNESKDVAIPKEYLPQR